MVWNMSPFFSPKATFPIVVLRLPQGFVGFVRNGNAYTQRVKVAALGGVVHYEFSVVVDYLGRPEVGLSPRVNGMEALCLLTPIHKIIADSNVKALGIVVTIGNVAIISSLEEQYLRVTYLCYVCKHHGFSL